MRKTGSLIALACSLIATSATADETPEALAKAKGCLACHSVDKKAVGPTYRDVARKYISELAPEERVAGLAPEERVAGLAPEELLGLLSREQIESYLKQKANKPAAAAKKKPRRR